MPRLVPCFTLIVTLLVSPWGMAEEDPVLRWGYVHFPPLVYDDASGTTRGELAELMDNVSRISGLSVKGKEYPNRRAVRWLTEAELNFAIGITTLIKDPENHLVSRFPVASIELKAYWLKGTPPIGRVQDLQKTNVALLSAYSYGGLRAYLDDPNNQITITSSVETHERALDALALKRAQYFLGYTGPAEKAIDARGDIDTESTVLSHYDLFFILHKATPNAEDVMARLESAYLQWQQNRRMPDAKH